MAIVHVIDLLLLDILAILMTEKFGDSVTNISCCIYEALSGKSVYCTDWIKWSECHDVSSNYV